MNVAEYLCKILEEKSVTDIFGLFGDIQTEFAHAVNKSRIRWRGVLHEQCAGYMADVYARTSGKVGLVFTTLGPGALNLANPLANATSDRSPLIAFSDQSPSFEHHLSTHQYIDLSQAFNPGTGITKFSATVTQQADLEKIINQAFQIATTEPMGAAHISIPADLFGQEVKKINKFVADAIKPYSPRQLDEITKTGSLSYDQIIERLYSKQAGLVIAGGSIERAHAQKKFLAFVEKFGLPVLTTFRGKNSIPSKHPQCLGTISRHLEPILQEVISNVPYLMLIGYDYNEGVKPSNWQNKKVAVLNLNSSDNRIPKLHFNPPTLIGDLKTILGSLSKEKKPLYNEQFKFHEVKTRIRKIIADALDVNNLNLHPSRIIQAVNKVYQDGVIVCDVGLNKYYSGLLLEATKTNKIFFSNGLSTMSFTSGALGAKVANPKKKVVALVGDGGFLMNPQELLTVAQNDHPIIWIIFNNGGLGLVEQAQKKKKPDNSHGVRFGKTNFSTLAEAFGIEGRRIEEGEEILPVLKELIKTGRPAVLDVPVEYTEKRKV